MANNSEKGSTPKNSRNKRKYNRKSKASATPAVSEQNKDAQIVESKECCGGKNESCTDMQTDCQTDQNVTQEDTQVAGFATWGSRFLLACLCCCCLWFGYNSINGDTELPQMGSLDNVTQSVGSVVDDVTISTTEAVTDGVEAVAGGVIGMIPGGPSSSAEGNNSLNDDMSEGMTEDSQMSTPIDYYAMYPNSFPMNDCSGCTVDNMNNVYSSNGGFIGIICTERTDVSCWTPAEVPNN